LNKFLFLILMLYSLSYAGCATTIDLQETQGKIDAEIRVLKEENAGIRQDTEKNDQTMAELRKRIADIAADMTEIREDMDSSKGDREVLGKGESDIRAEFTRKEKEFGDIKNLLDQLSSRMNVMENLLEIGRSPNQTPKADKVSSDNSNSTVPGKTEKDSAYDSAYQAFKEEQYEKAREGFQDFLKKYPNTEYSDSAQFWIGESYYFERKYEQAILEYEKVIKDYPQGNKVPNAMLKQGFSFLNLGDKSSAKLLLEQLAKNYPGTSQARMAKAKLAEIK
jgi:tol-pal system protein YbgF